MVRSTTRALAGTAASAARKVIGRRPRTDAEAEIVTSAASDGPAAGTSRTAREKAAATRSPARATTPKTTARKSTTRTASKSTTTTTTTSSKATTTPVTTAKKTTASAPAATRKAAVKPAAKTAAKTAATAAAKAPVKSSSRAGSKAASATDLLATLVVREGEDAWTAAELQEVVDGLHQARTHSVELLEEAEAGLDGLMRDSGDGAGQDQADMGATTFERDHELTVVNSERDKLAQIDRALGHIDDGTYGVCEACAEPIGKGRLMAFPRATLCMTCKQREERR